jgi:DNA-binding protein H-NS
MKKMATRKNSKKAPVAQTTVETPVETTVVETTVETPTTNEQPVAPVTAPEAPEAAPVAPTTNTQPVAPEAAPAAPKAPEAAPTTPAPTTPAPVVPTPTWETGVLSSIQWGIVKDAVADLDVDGLKEVLEYVSVKIEELQKEEVEALEAQMRAIQDKLLALKGFRNKPVARMVAPEKTEKTEKTEGAKRNVKPLVNPENPEEVYTFGKHPAWLVTLCAKTGKTPYELRQAA